MKINSLIFSADFKSSAGNLGKVKTKKICVLSNKIRNI